MNNLIASRQESQKRAKPLLMIPLRRCGSHALRLRLNLSPNFYSPYPVHLVDFMPLVPLYGDLSDDFSYFQLTIDVVGLLNSTMVKWENVSIDPVSIFEAVSERPRSIHTILWEMLFQSGKKHGATVVMDKSLDSIYYAEEMIDLFDDMIFLNVVRDPRSQVSSMNRAIIYDFDTCLNALRWLHAHRTAKALAQKYPSKVLTIKFEDFLMNQEEVLVKICQFIGIEFIPAMLDVSKSQEAQRMSTMSALWQTNTSAPIMANIDKYMKHLTKEEIQMIETICAELMDDYGYSRFYKEDTRLTNEIIARAKAQSETEKTKAWEALKENDPRDYQLRQFRNEYINMVKARLGG